MYVADEKRLLLFSEGAAKTEVSGEISMRQVDKLYNSIESLSDGTLLLIPGGHQWKKVLVGFIL